MKKWVLAALLTYQWGLAQAPSAFGIEKRPQGDTLTIKIPGDTLVQYKVEPAFPNLIFPMTTVLTHAKDQTGRVFLGIFGGIIYVFQDSDNVSEFKKFLDISDQVTAEIEGGLMSVAFHPNYKENGKFFVLYTSGEVKSPSYRGVLSQFTVSSANPDSAVRESEKIIWSEYQPTLSHQANCILFGKDGFLYLALGDGGWIDTSFGKNSQNLTSLRGKILRMDVDSPAVGKNYAIPTGNPLFGNTQGFREEIWSWGLRNPWRMALDSVTGDIWVGDVGAQHEEINLVQKSGNYGWPVQNDAASYSNSAFVAPLLKYGRTEGKCLIAGLFVRDSAEPTLEFVFADFVHKTIFGVHKKNNRVEKQLMARIPRAPIGFGTGEKGQLYIFTMPNGIYKLVRKDSINISNQVSVTLQETGVYTDISAKKLNPGFIPYSVNSPRWEKEVVAERYIYLPDNKKMVFSSGGPYEYPDGTVFLKNIMKENKEGKKKYLESRLLIKRDGLEDWEGMVYLWDDLGSKALLVPRDTTIEITDGSQKSGGNHGQNYKVWGSKSCNKCHNSEARFVQGFFTRQLNKIHQYGNLSDNQFRSFFHIELFKRDYEDETPISRDVNKLSKIPDYTNTSLYYPSRGKSFLEGNCASCHTYLKKNSKMDMRYLTNVKEAGLVNVSATSKSGRIIDASFPENSVLIQYLSDSTLSIDTLPAHGNVDSPYVELVLRWIRSIYIPNRYGIAKTEVRMERGKGKKVIIQFDLVESNLVEVAIYDSEGKKMAKLLHKFMDAGRHQVSWNGSPSGRDGAGKIYYATFLVGKTRFQKRFSLH